MGKRKIVFSIDEYYHVYSRGVEKRQIFLDDDDYERFVRLLYLCNGNKPIVFKLFQGRSLDECDRGEPLTAIGAYCLMPNHFHLLLRETNEGGITEFMRKLMTAYSMYFNKKNERTGTLFEGIFKAEHATEDAYLKYLLAYIHLNPLKLIEPKWREIGLEDPGKAKLYLAQYKYSSYQDYLQDKLQDKRPQSCILSSGPFPDYFQDRKEFDGYINDWLAFQAFQGRSLDKQVDIQGPSLE